MNTDQQPGAASVAARLQAAPAGSLFQGRLTVGETATGQPISLPYMVAKGREPGPVLWLNGAVHGDELNGVLGAIDFYREVDPAFLCGTLIVTPVANALAVDDRHKINHFDHLDLDQQFPGSATGLLTQRLAHALFHAIAPLAHVTVNMHTHGTQYASLPYGVYKQHPGCPLPEAALLSLVAAFDPSLVCRMPVAHAPGELPGNIAGALDYQCSALGKVAFMMEMGGGGREEPAYVEATRQGFRNLAAALGMWREGAASPVTPVPQQVRHVTARQHVLADRGGFFRTTVVPGDLVKAGELIGIIHDVTGQVVQEVRLEGDCIIIGIRFNPVIHTGDRICFIGRQWETVETDPHAAAAYFSTL